MTLLAEALGARDLRAGDLALGLGLGTMALLVFGVALAFGRADPASLASSAPPLVAVAIGVAPDRPPLARPPAATPAAEPVPSASTPSTPPAPDSPARASASPKTTPRPKPTPGATVPAIDPPPGTAVGPTDPEHPAGAGDPTPGIPPSVLAAYRDRLARWFASRFRVTGSGLDTAALMKLRAKAVVTVSSDGAVESYALTESGNEAFDAAARRALDGAVGEPVPSPPESYPAALPPRLHITFVCKPTTCD